MQASSQWADHGRLVGMALLWGVSWPTGKILALAMPALSAAAWRFSLAVPLLAAWLVARDGLRWPRLSWRQWAGLGVGGAVGVYGYSIMFMLALQHVDASRAALVVTTNPVITTVLAAWLFRERINGRVLLGLTLALAGATVVLTRGEPWRLFTQGIGVGEWLLLGCVTSWVVYTLVGRALMQGIDSLTATTVTTGVGLVLLWATALAFEGSTAYSTAITSLSWQGWASLVFLAVGATVLAYAWFNQGIAALGAGAAASYISLVPVFGVASSLGMLGEKPDASLWAGGAMALAGLVINNRARRA